jgi:hypothetical protein
MDLLSIFKIKNLIKKIHVSDLFKSNKVTSKHLSDNITSSQGSNNVINNINIGGISIGDPVKILGSPDVIKEVSFEEVYKKGLDLLDVNNTAVEEAAEFVEDLYEKIRNRHGRQVTRTATTMFQGSIFALGTSIYPNPEWKEHASSSLREIFHEWSSGDISSDFSNFYRSDGVKLTLEEKDIFRELRSHYQYFSGIDHHDASKIKSSLMSILNDQSLKLEDCLAKDVFIGRVNRFFELIKIIIELK